MSIDTAYFKELLLKLGFEEISNVMYGSFGHESYNMSVDFNVGKINYGDLIDVKSEELKNFDQNETMVVLECVVSLLKQGYKAKNIILNPRWKVGHGASGGIADIQIIDNNDKSYLLIECKTFGEQFTNEWKNTEIDGGQLFSYYQQDKNTKFLALYASQLNSKKEVERQYYLINVKDDEKNMYKNAQTKEESYKVWAKVYDYGKSEHGIFEDNQAYNIGINKVKVTNLKEVSSDKMYETDKNFKIALRQHNIGSHENAFDKLVNLFLAKIVDETYNTEDLQFCWKGVAQDDTKALIDRLQILYKKGMKEFLDEDVTYVDKDEIDNAFRFFKNDVMATKTTVMQYFDELKYYTNNDFAFLDVHNEELFKQNAELLKKIVVMLQGLKLKTEEHNQFLGDLFEGFLDNGVKQSEGQYFTPLPIVRFIVSSLPLEQKIKENGAELLKMIDYACGAGHFLNEYANQIAKFTNSNREYFKNTFGIEKEYRLSKVSKVSAFMYGQDEINIIYDDALKHSRVKDNEFDIIIANPPYSVPGFLETLPEDERKKYELNNAVNNIVTNGKIETFFIERTKQLLKTNGVAGIVLPSTLLHKTDNMVVLTREILLKYFDIIGIVLFPGSTFGKTNVSTMSLFLRRKSFPPESWEHIKDRIENFYNGNHEYDEVFEDLEMIEKFCKYRQIDYESFIKNPLDYENEKEKLFYFYMVSLQDNPVIIVDATFDNKKTEAKEFLGYEWTSRNKSHHIQYMHLKGKNKNGKSNSKEDDNEEENIVSSKEGIDQIKTRLFNPNDLYGDSNKINCIIRANYNNEEFEIPDDLTDIVSIENLVDLIDFEANDFKKVISTNTVKKIELNYTKYNKQSVKSIISKNIKSKTKVETAKDSKEGQYIFFTSGKATYKTNDYLVDGDNIFINTGGKADIKFYSGKANYSTDTLSIKSKDETKVTTKYIYSILNSIVPEINEFYFKGATIKHLNKTKLNETEIPIAPLDIQKQIVAEYEKVDKKIQANDEIISECRLNIDKIVRDALQNSKKEYKLSDDIFTIFLGKRVCKYETDKNGEYPVISANVNEIFGRINVNPEETIKEIKTTKFTYDSILWGIDGDWMVSFMPKGKSFYPTDHCGVLRIKDPNINSYFFKFAFDLTASKYNFDRVKRANTDAIKNISIKLPDLSIQNDACDKIKKLENRIKKAEDENNLLQENKHQILDKYLL